MGRLQAKVGEGGLRSPEGAAPCSCGFDEPVEQCTWKVHQWLTEYEQRKIERAVEKMLDKLYLAQYQMVGKEALENAAFAVYQFGKTHGRKWSGR